MNVGVTQTGEGNSIQNNINFYFKALKALVVYLSLINGSQELSDERCVLLLLMMSIVYFLMCIYSSFCL